MHAPTHSNILGRKPKLHPYHIWYTALRMTTLLLFFSVICAFTLPYLLHIRHPRLHPALWLNHLRSLHADHIVKTVRTACREYQALAQSCQFNGFICVNTSHQIPFDRPQVYLVDDSYEDFTPVPSDNWCSFRFQSADPRYYGPRHWPLLNHTVVPQQSCMNAFYRTSASLLSARLAAEPILRSSIHDSPLLLLPRARMLWLSSPLWLVDLDYVNNSHNMHLLMDIAWMLDVELWQRSIQLHNTQSRGTPSPSVQGVFSVPRRHVYLPQGIEDFGVQTSRDINRLNYALTLQLNLNALYPTLSAAQLSHNTKQKRWAETLLKAYPNLTKNHQLLFHRELYESSEVDLVCTSSLVSGAKLASLGHERVCRSMRQRAHALFGIQEPDLVRVGQIFYPRPPRKIIVLDRHITRGIGNIQELERQLRAFFERKRFEVEIVSTARIQTAEDHVRLFSKAGVLLTPHGSQSMGMIYMPRHSALIEVMPVGCVDYLFNVMAESCKVWYYELQSRMDPGTTDAAYKARCEDHTPHMLNPCGAFKNEQVWVDIPEAIKTITLALERLGYVTGPWLRSA
ncbi:hypothetical protein BWQ96_03466 [Gracilariopsis chorda]|uniref:Glycosyltransferase 61 catalytic domain-containing protein n=1 Tax=Gracilariopsis chorda TaxID=448386 RepID=A0A2V3IXI5_9FLOR|nr:hypothetical protein BWQ96_03466 [Gracilariopsis chorda]|eukprot:PXF46775.1 hypothetical protein BWQ96_03466 [Gracilariopsis chorda]